VDTPSASDTVSVVSQIVQSKEPATLVLALIVCFGALYAIYDMRRRYKEVDTLRLGTARMYQLLIILASAPAFEFELPDFEQLIDPKYSFNLSEVLRKRISMRRRTDELIAADRKGGADARYKERE